MIFWYTMELWYYVITILLYNGIMVYYVLMVLLYYGSLASSSSLFWRHLMSSSYFLSWPYSYFWCTRLAIDPSNYSILMRCHCMPCLHICGGFLLIKNPVFYQYSLVLTNNLGIDKLIWSSKVNHKNIWNNKESELHLIYDSENLQLQHISYFGTSVRHSSGRHSGGRLLAMT